MTDDARGSELEAEDGEVLPAREVMSIISTDPSDAFPMEPAPPIESGPPSPDGGIQPVEHQPSDPPHTLPVEESPAA